jgi:hypothetical protein
MRQPIPFHLLELAGQAASLAPPLPREEVRPVIPYLLETGWTYTDLAKLMIRVKISRFLATYNTGSQPLACKTCGKSCEQWRFSARRVFCSKVCSNKAQRAKKSGLPLPIEEVRAWAKEQLQEWEQLVKLGVIFRCNAVVPSPDWDRLPDGHAYQWVENWEQNARFRPPGFPAASPPAPLPHGDLRRAVEMKPVTGTLSMLPEEPTVVTFDACPESPHG